MSKIIHFYDSDDKQDDSRPLPIIIAETYNFPLQAHDTEDGVYYSALDWIAGIATTTNRNASKMWNWMQKQLSLSTRQLKYQAVDGKEYDTDFTDDEGLYKIAAHMRNSSKRKALKEIKDYLAKAGVFADEARRDPESIETKAMASRRAKALREGKGDQWMATREIGVVTRKQLTAYIKYLLGGKADGKFFRTITNDTYRGVFGMNAVQMREHMGIPIGANVREFMSVLGLIFTMQAEELCNQMLSKYKPDDIVTPHDVRMVIIKITRFVGRQVEQSQELTGRDVLTGRNLLPPSGNDEPVA